MLKSVIFDMDGVILDSEPIHLEVDKMVLKECDFDATDEILIKYIGMSNPDMWKDLKKKYSLKPSVEELLELQKKLKIKVYEETKLEAIKGINELLDDLVENKIMISLASSSPRYFIEAVLNKLLIRDYFKFVISGEEVEKGKPYPDIFLKTAEKLGINPEECVVIEDSKNGVRAAIAAGMKCIGYNNPNSGAQDLSEASAIVNTICAISYNFIKYIIGS